MPRPKVMIDKQKLEILLALCTQVFGKPLQHSFECDQLSKDIERHTEYRIGANTIRRIFGFIDTPFAPSTKTLNVLSSYAGFQSWHRFLQETSLTSFKPLTIDQEAFLYLQFYKIEAKAEGDMNYHNASRNIALRILFNQDLLSKTSAALAKSPVARIYFFERFPFIDGLGGEYKRSIQLYLQKKEDEAQLFGNSLLFLSAFLCNNKEEAETYAVKVNKIRIKETMHPFLIARYIGTNILLERLKGKDVTNHWKAEAVKWNSYFLSKGEQSFWRYPYFQHMMADYFNLAGLFKESYQIVRTVKQQYGSFEIEKGYVEALEVISEIAHSYLDSSLYLNRINRTNAFEKMHPLFQKYYKLQALYVKRTISIRQSSLVKINTKIEELVKQTGFVHFLNQG